MTATKIIYANMSWLTGCSRDNTKGMAQYRTMEALAEVGALRQFLDAVSPKDAKALANMTTSFEHLIEAGAEHDSFAPTSTGVFERPLAVDTDEDTSPTIPVAAHMAEDLAQDPTLTEVDKYASRRGANHWTRRRPTQGPTRKLTDEDALVMREAYAAGRRVVDLAATYGVTTSTVYGVLRGKTHKRAEAGWVETPVVALP